MPPRLMLQGTGSDVGKSLLVAGLCRLFARRGLRVRPFKPQNMSNNAAVTAEGGEIGRAQALQARAAGLAPRLDMNPVLLKPQGKSGAQVIVQGRMQGTYDARAYQELKPRLMQKVLESLARLGQEADLLLIEGAGAAAEINLRAHDIANMGFAQASATPVVVVGDIDRGGVIASLVGTRAVLDPRDAALIKGFIVNRFRGDARLFAEGMREIAARTGWEALGLVPHFSEAGRLPAEDSLGLFTRHHTAGSAARRVAVPALPSIANFDDLDPLLQEEGVRVELIPLGRPLPLGVDAILLPGSKATLDDLAALKAEGWDVDIRAHHRQGGKVMGLCGGYQILGKDIDDSFGIEGPPRREQGLGLLDVATVLGREKRLDSVAGTIVEAGVPFTGYEMHVGVTQGPDRVRPFARIGELEEGARAPDGRVIGTYCHGLFAHDAARRWFLSWIGAQASDFSYEETIDRVLDRLADHLEAHLAVDELLAISQGAP